MWQWISTFLDRICAVTGAFVFAQFPAFFQQYTQRLAGHLTELHRHILDIQRFAEMTGKSLPEYIHKFLLHSDRDIAQQGVWMQGLVERHTYLTQESLQLQNTTPWTKPFLFIRHVDVSIAEGTWRDFQPAVSLTMEGALYALVGVFVGYLFYYFCLSIISELYTNWIFNKEISVKSK